MKKWDFVNADFVLKKNQVPPPKILPQNRKNYLPLFQVERRVQRREKKERRSRHHSSSRHHSGWEGHTGGYQGKFSNFWVSSMWNYLWLTPHFFWVWWWVCAFLHVHVLSVFRVSSRSNHILLATSPDHSWSRPCYDWRGDEQSCSRGICCCWWSSQR